MSLMDMFSDWYYGKASTGRYALCKHALSLYLPDDVIKLINGLCIQLIYKPHRCDIIYSIEMRQNDGYTCYHNRCYGPHMETNVIVVRYGYTASYMHHGIRKYYMSSDIYYYYHLSCYIKAFGQPYIFDISPYLPIGRS